MDEKRRRLSEADRPSSVVKGSSPRREGTGSEGLLPGGAEKVPSRALPPSHQGKVRAEPEGRAPTRSPAAGGWGWTASRFPRTQAGWRRLEAPRGKRVPGRSPGSDADVRPSDLGRRRALRSLGLRLRGGGSSGRSGGRGAAGAGGGGAEGVNAPGPPPLSAPPPAAEGKVPAGVRPRSPPPARPPRPRSRSRPPSPRCEPGAATRAPLPGPGRHVSRVSGDPGPSDCGAGTPGSPFPGGRGGEAEWPGAPGAGDARWVSGAGSSFPGQTGAPAAAGDARRCAALGPAGRRPGTRSPCAQPCPRGPPASGAPLVLHPQWLSFLRPRASPVPWPPPSSPLKDFSLQTEWDVQVKPACGGGALPHPCPLG